MPKQSVDTRSGYEISDAHPLLAWYAALHEWGVSVKGADMVVSTLVSGRFSIATDRDGEVALGVQVADLPAITSVTWQKAVLLRGFRHKDWLTLASRDPLIEVNGKPSPLRLFLPTAVAIADAITAFDGGTLRIRPVKVDGDVAAISKGQPRAEMPFSVRRHT